MQEDIIQFLKGKANWVRRATFEIARIAPGIRLASSLSPIEILTVLYYGRFLKFAPKNPNWAERDRLIISKGHGSICMYPILADLGFFDQSLLQRVGQKDSFLADIPDTRIPGYETINGAMAHGLGVACGMSIALKRKSSTSKVFVVSGDGELYSGAMWEAIMFAPQHRLGNLTLIVDQNKTAMLDFCKNIIDLEPLAKKLQDFGWRAAEVDGHNVEHIYSALKTAQNDSADCPKVLLAHTIKGKGAPQLEGDPLCHIKNLKEEELLEIIEKLS